MKNSIGGSIVLRSSCIAIILLSALPLAVHAQAGAQTEDLNSATKGLLLLDILNLKLETIRSYIGKPTDEVANIIIKNATAREVFYQAVNLYNKSDRLAQEIVRHSSSLDPGKLNSESREEAVITVINATMQRIDAVVEELGIQPHPAPEKNYSKIHATNSDLYVAILNTNQDINQLLDNKYRPAEVYQQLTNAIHIALTLFERFPETPRDFSEPEFIPGKTPSDVFNLLIECYMRIREIAMLSKIEVLEIHSVSKNGLYVPSEVYDIATLLVSELSYIHDTVPGLSKANNSYFPGRVYPSDVYQRGLLLKRLLSNLHDLIMKNPDWRR
ncbi:MAG: hypothetical protein P8171_20585 [Candidatus Thiodiazotropha sp.]